MTTMKPTANQTLCSSTNGKMEPRLATAEAIDTATVST